MKLLTPVVGGGYGVSVLADLSGTGKNLLGNISSTPVDFGAIVNQVVMSTVCYVETAGTLTRLRVYTAWGFELWIDGKLFISRGASGSSTTTQEIIDVNNQQNFPKINIKESLEFKAYKPSAGYTNYDAVVQIVETK